MSRRAAPEQCELDFSPRVRVYEESDAPAGVWPLGMRDAHRLGDPDVPGDVERVEAQVAFLVRRYTEERAERVRAEGARKERREEPTTPTMCAKKKSSAEGTAKPKRRARGTGERDRSITVDGQPACSKCHRAPAERRPGRSKRGWCAKCREAWRAKADPVAAE